MNDNRFPVALLSMSAAGLVGLAIHEGYSDRAIIPVAGDPPTYGFGSTTKEDGSPVTLKDRTTPPKALRLAVKDIAGKEAVLRNCIKVPLSQAEWDLYVNHAYNVGPYRFCNSGIVTRLNALDYSGACQQILLWKFVRGTDCSLPENRSVCGGLWDRRLEQYKKCMESQL